MSVAALRPTHEAGWQPAPCTVFTSPLSHTSFGPNPTSGYNESYIRPHSVSVTSGHPDDDCIANTNRNNRVSGDGYEARYGQGASISTKINVFNIERYLRNLTKNDPDSWKDPTIRDQVSQAISIDLDSKEPILKTPSFQVDLPSVQSKIYHDTRSETEAMIKSCRRQYQKSKDTKHIMRADEVSRKEISTNKSLVENWLRGEKVFDQPVKTQLNLMNMNKFLKRHKDLSSDKSYREKIQGFLLGQEAGVELSYEDSERLSDGSHYENKVVSGISKDQGKDGVREWQREKMRGIDKLTRDWYRSSGITDEQWQSELESMEKDLKAKGKLGGSSSGTNDKSSRGSGDGEGHKTKTSLSILNLDTFLENYSELAKDARIQEAVKRTLKGEQIPISFGSESIATKLNEATRQSSEVLSKFEESEDKEGMKSWQKERMGKIGKMLAKWEEQSGKSMKEWGESGSGSQSGGSSDSSGGPSASSSLPDSIDKSDLVEIELTRYNLPELLSCYTDPNRPGNSSEIQSFLYKGLPPNHPKVKKMYELISQTDQSQKIKLPSRLAKTLSSVQTRTSHDLDSLGGDQSKIKSWKHFQDLKSKAALHNWKYSHKGDDRTPLGKSTTSVPGIHRRPISDATRTAGRSDKSRIDQIDRFVSDSNSTDTVDDKQWWIMDQSLRSKYGYGKHGMKVDKEDQLRRKRSWNGVDSSGSYLDSLNKTYCTDSSTNSSPGDSDTPTARTPLISASA
ncbi:hypothetical protein L486_00025 [Kwoniella mangroviensis CBS 10435]|uniref:Uncharacterized protein n=1 Tax=Kwoniella mangroviensis CBS 10435 TaxID=1331196 RepID=A0A1B9IY00_9TREE|nr:hypothetical protein L486_00025 [Kwoniella mangroviensis CBS 10435]